MLIQRRFIQSLLQLRQGLVESFAELESILQTLGLDLFSQRQVIQLDRLVRVLIEPVGVVGLAEKAGRAALADHIGFLKGPGHFHKRQDRTFRRFEVRNVRTCGGKISGRRRFQLSGRRNAVRLKSGQHLIDGGRVVEQPFGGIAHGSDQRALIHLFSQQRHRLAQPDSRYFRLDRFELAANIGRRIRFGIPDVYVTGPALQEQQNHGFRRPKSLHS